MHFCAASRQSCSGSITDKVKGCHERSDQFNDFPPGSRTGMERISVSWPELLFGRSV